MIRRSTDYLVVHCSATPGTLDIGATEIRGWHKAKGWSDIGYHFVIRRDGKVELGRPENMVGSHVQGHNANSLGICLVGGTDAKQRPQNNFTPEQWASLQTLLMRLTQKYRGATILGHRDFPKVAKACPCFDAIKWAQEMGLPAAPRMRSFAASMLIETEARPEIEDGDEAEPGEGQSLPPDAAPPATSGGKWLTALFFNAFPVDRGTSKTRPGMSKKLLDHKVPTSASPKNATGSTQIGRFASRMKLSISMVGTSATNHRPTKMAGREVDHGSDAAIKTAMMSAG